MVVAATTSFVGNLGLCSFLHGEAKVDCKKQPFLFSFTSFFEKKILSTKNIVFFSFKNVFFLNIYLYD